jgi:hypothetical protein
VAGTYSTTYKWIIWCSIAFVVLYTFTFFIIIVMSCVPIYALWHQYDPGFKTPYRCSSSSSAYASSMVTGVLSVVSDLYSVLLPAYLLFSLAISRKRKLGLAVIFGAGFL